MKNSDALIGHTGCVGSSLYKQHLFDGYNTKNADDVSDKEYDIVVCSAAPGVKWKANDHPGEDYKSITDVMRLLDTVKMNKLVLISTIDVYHTPYNVTEQDVPKIEFESPNCLNTSYSINRILLERYVMKRPDYLIVRLPSLFGETMNGGFVCDVINDNEQFIPKGGNIQLYHLDNLWGDISKAIDAGINMLNIATEPIPVDVVTQGVFNEDDYGNPMARDPNHNMKTIHAGLWGIDGNYMQTSQEVMSQLLSFVL